MEDVRREVAPSRDKGTVPSPGKYNTQNVRNDDSSK
jgi:hypothetical protein